MFSEKECEYVFILRAFESPSPALSRPLPAPRLQGIPLDYKDHRKGSQHQTFGTNLCIVREMGRKGADFDPNLKVLTNKMFLLKK